MVLELFGAPLKWHQMVSRWFEMQRPSRQAATRQAGLCCVVPRDDGFRENQLGFPGGSAGKESACNVGELGPIPGLRRFPGEGNSYPLQYAGLENSTGCIVHGVTMIWLSYFHFPLSFVSFELASAWTRWVIQKQHQYYLVGGRMGAKCRSLGNTDKSLRCTLLNHL